MFNERDDAAELKNLPIDDNMHGIIEEEEMEDEGSDQEDVVDEAAERWRDPRTTFDSPQRPPRPALFRTLRTMYKGAWQYQWMGVQSLKSN